MALLNKNGGGSIKNIVLLVTSILLINACSSSDGASKVAQAKNYYVTPLQTQSKTISGVDLSSGSLSLTQSDVRGKKLLNFARVYSLSNKDNNNSFGNFKLSLNSKINPKLDYIKEPVASSKYQTPKDACESGFNQIAPKIYLGKLTNAQAIYNDKLKTCDIYEDSKIVATLLIKDASKKALANKDLILLKKPNGKELLFFKNKEGNYQSLTKEPIELEKTDNGYRVTYSNDLIENYDTKGNLIKLQKEASYINIAYNKKEQIKTLSDNYNKQITFNYDTNSSLIKSVTNYDDTNTSYTYDKNSNLIKVTLPDGTSRSYEYNQEGKLTALINATGVKTRTYSYENNKVTSTSEAKGANKQNFSYSSDTTTVTKDGVANEYSFKIINSIPKVNTITSDEGIEAYSYDEKGNPTSYTNKLGVKTLTTYNDRGLLVSKVSNAGTKDEQITLISYHDRLHKPTKVVKAGVATFYSYSDKGLLTKKIVGSVSPALKRITPNNRLLVKSLKVTDTTEQKEYSFAYDENGNPTAQTQPNGATTETKYDKEGNPKEQKNALGFTSKVTKFDKAGRALESIDYNGIVTKTKYDKLGRVLETNVDGKVTSYQYDKDGRVTKTTYPDKTYSYSKYDEAGNVVESGDSQGNKTLNRYDKNNNLIETKSYKNDKLIYASKSEYDNKNRLIASIDSFGNETKYIYNQKGQKTKTVDALNRETKYEYDSLGRLTKTIYPDGTSSTYTYNAKGLKTKVTTPNNSTFTFSYDNFDRTIKKASSDSGATTLTYDISDNIKTKTNANGNTITYEYDIGNRKTKESLSNDRGTEEVSYTYDEGENAKGKLTTVTDSAQTTHYSYDKDGNIINIEQTINGNTFTREFTYNEQNKLTSQTLPSGKVINYHYNDKQELSSIDIDGQTLIENITKNRNGLVSYSYPNGNTHTREYDTNGRVTKLIYPNYTEDVTYDKVSNITKLIEDSNRTKTFNYDLRDRLTKFEQNATNYQNFSYDPNGNRLTLNQEVNKTISYLYKEKSNILQTIAHYKRVDENNTIKENEQNLSYDKAGNIIGDDKHIYTYDAKNRLIKIDNNITYTYNYKNQRVSKTVNNKTTYYIYDDYKLIGEYNEDGTAIKEYIYLDDTPIAILQDNKVYYIYADHLNTQRRVATSEDNTIVWKWESKPFGEDEPTGTYTLNLRFPGQYFDKESGFSYNINRYYNPKLGRYMQSDPIGLEGGENSFVYVGANPLVRVDESGLDIAVITGDKYDSSWNIFGHSALAISGKGVYSWGTAHNWGTPLIDYLWTGSIEPQLKHRNIFISVFKTTSLQDKRALAAYFKIVKKGYSEWDGRTCATAVAAALKYGIGIKNITLTRFPAKLQREAYKYSSYDIYFEKNKFDITTYWDYMLWEFD